MKENFVNVPFGIVTSARYKVHKVSLYIHKRSYGVDETNLIPVAFTIIAINSSKEIFPSKAFSNCSTNQTLLLFCISHLLIHSMHMNTYIPAHTHTYTYIRRIPCFQQTICWYTMTTLSSSNEITPISTWFFACLFSTASNISSPFSLMLPYSGPFNFTSLRWIRDQGHSLVWGTLSTLSGKIKCQSDITIGEACMIKTSFLVKLYEVNYH